MTIFNENDECQLLFYQATCLGTFYFISLLLFFFIRSNKFFGNIFYSLLHNMDEVSSTKRKKVSAVTLFQNLDENSIWGD